MHTLPSQGASTTEPLEEFSSLVRLRFLKNLAAFVTLQKAFRTPVVRAPIPGIRKARAVGNVANC